MFGNKKRRIPVSKDDIKKAIKAANNRLQKQNDKIQSNVADAESQFKSIKSDIKSAKKELKDYTSRIDSRISECAAIEQQLLALQTDLNYISGNCAKELAVEELLKSSVLDLSKKEQSLIKSVALLDQKKDNAKSINADLKSAKNSYDEVKKDLTKIISDKESALSAVTKANISKDIAEESCAKIVNELAETKININRQIQDMDSTLKEKSDSFNAETSRLDNIIAERLEEVEINTSLAVMKAREYEAILTKVIVGENKIKHADQKVASILKRQEESIANIKKRFETWKLTQLDQMAKLKLKGKIENIDKAGLSEILGG
jgi:chromosome segregation ATPase